TDFFCNVRYVLRPGFRRRRAPLRRVRPQTAYCHPSTKILRRAANTALIGSLFTIDATAVPEPMLCGDVTTPRKRSWPFRPHHGVYELTTEASMELVGVLALRKAEYRHVDIVLTIRVAAPAEREAFCLAEDVDGQVLVAHAAVSGQCDLVRPVS